MRVRVDSVVRVGVCRVAEVEREVLDFVCDAGIEVNLVGNASLGGGVGPNAGIGREAVAEVVRRVDLRIEGSARESLAAEDVFRFKSERERRREFVENLRADFFVGESVDYLRFGLSRGSGSCWSGSGSRGGCYNRSFRRVGRACACD